MPLNAHDLRGLLRLGTEAGVGAADIAEGLHRAILAPMGLARGAAPGRTPGLTGFVYRRVRQGLAWGGRGGDALLARLAPHLPAPRDSAQRQALLAVLNGVWGDRLADSGNPLAITTALRTGGQALRLERGALAARLPAATGRIAVLAHGLCMNDLQWRRRGHDHGDVLASAGWTPLYLHYNSGRHVWENGADAAALLDDLVAAWPVPVQALALVGHSMGGLVLRSACRRAETDRRPWRALLRHLVCLGTPHHGAPLERGGHVVTLLLGASAYAAPFARLARARSAGITDLRHGHLQAADGPGRDRHAQARDRRVPTPLPAGVATSLVAATTADRADSRRGRWVGDGLVPLASALGEHRNPALALDGVPAARRLVVTRANHWDLLCHPAVADALRHWLD